MQCPIEGRQPIPLAVLGVLAALVQRSPRARVGDLRRAMDLGAMHAAALCGTGLQRAPPPGTRGPATEASALVQERPPNALAVFGGLRGQDQRGGLRWQRQFQPGICVRAGVGATPAICTPNAKKLHRIVRRKLHRIVHGMVHRNGSPAISINRSSGSRALATRRPEI
jgi:hypothetical protein